MSFFPNMIEKREDCLTESKEIMGIVEVNVDVLLFLRHLKQSVRASFRSRRRGWIPWSWGGWAVPPGVFL